jgi:hypothetical protein
MTTVTYLMDTIRFRTKVKPVLDVEDDFLPFCDRQQWFLKQSFSLCSVVVTFTKREDLQKILEESDLYSNANALDRCLRLFKNVGGDEARFF